jgi:glycosyltransferase involved in cell wall biosynthesis
MYNRLPFTVRAVRSVLKQTYGDLEIIVVDDCSTERPESADFGDDPRVRLIRHEVNRGVGAARNTGVQAARGEVVAFLDSDDYWLLEKLASQMALFEQQADKNRVMVYSIYYYEKDGQWVAEPFEPLGQNEAVSDYLFVHLGDIHTSTWLGSRALFEKYRFCEELLRHQDWDLLLELEAAGVRFVHCPIPAGVRAADLRKDRLSTAAVMPMRRLFLDKNLERMTAQSSVLMEAVYLSLGQPEDSFLQKQFRQVAYLANSGRLTFAQRAGLVFAYIKARLLFKLMTRLRGQAPQNFEFGPQAPG